MIRNKSQKIKSRKFLNHKLIYIVLIELRFYQKVNIYKIQELLKQNDEYC